MDGFQKQLNLVRYRLRQLQERIRELENGLELLEKLHFESVKRAWLSSGRGEAGKGVTVMASCHDMKGR